MTIALQKKNDRRIWQTPLHKKQRGIKCIKDMKAAAKFVKPGVKHEPE